MQSSQPLKEKSIGKISADVKQKISIVLKNERAKRVKAESTLDKQNEMLKELNEKIELLQEQHHKNLAAQQQGTSSVRSLNHRPSETNNSSKETTKTNMGIDKSNQYLKASQIAKVSADSIHPRATLTEAIDIGSKRLVVDTVEGFKRGMRVVIGSRLTAEVATITGIGSILINPAVIRNHEVGEPVIAFSNHPKGQRQMNRYLAKEFVLGLLYDEIIPVVCSTGDKDILTKELNFKYSRRPVLRHNSTVQTMREIKMNGTKMVSLTSSWRSSKLLMAIDGRIQTCDFSFNVVDLINIFEDTYFEILVAGKYHLKGKNGLELKDINSRDVVSAYDMLNVILASKKYHTTFQHLAEEFGYKSVEDMLCSCCDEDGRMTWRQFHSGIISPTSTRNVNSTSQAEDIRASSQLDADSFLLLTRAFDLCDCDDDELVAYEDIPGIFASIDGYFSDPSLLDRIVARVTGERTEGARFNALNFLALRKEYAIEMNTLIGGFRLYGRNTIRYIMRGILKEHPLDELYATSITVEHLLTVVPGFLLDAVFLPNHLTLRGFLSGRTTTNLAELLSLIDEEGQLAGQIPRQRTWTSLGSDRITQLLLDPSEQRCFAVASTGIVYCYDMHSGRQIFKQRLVWSEPLPSRDVESSDRFLRWRKDSKLLPDHTGTGTGIGDEFGNRSNVLEVEQTSSLLSEFFFSLSCVTKLLFIDRSTGYIAVNASAINGSINIHDPLSLRRLYRVRPPGRLSKEVDDVMRNISCGRLTQISQINDLTGVIENILFWSEKSILICSLFGYSTIHAIDMCTGALVAELAGHTSMLSTVSLVPDYGAIISGSKDGSLRVWRAQDCFPSLYFHTAGQTEDTVLASLEGSVTRDNVTGATSRGSTILLKALSLKLCASLGISPKWRYGIISGFFDGKSFQSSVPPRQQTMGIEVVFADSYVKLYNNSKLLREPWEAKQRPRGPPMWSMPEASLSFGKHVTTFEIDPEDAVIHLSRALGISCVEEMSFSRWVSALQHVLNQTTAPSEERLLESELIDVTAALAAIGFDRRSTMSTLHLARKLVDVEVRGKACKCDRALIGGHATPVVSIQWLHTSTLLVSVDSSGTCCVWDPCMNARVSLTYQDSNFIGNYPFMLCAQLHIFNNLSVSRLSSVSAKVTDSTKLMIPQDLRNPFPVNPTSLMNAYKLDEKNLSKNIQTRGFIYVYLDFTYDCIESSCFIPEFISLDEAEYFLTTNSSSSNWIQSKSNNIDILEIQKIYKHKESILRIIYTTSSQHNSISSLATDLLHYGVIHRGYHLTPSEAIEVICFERDKNWLERKKGAVLDANPPPTFLTGIIVGHEEGDVRSRSTSKFRVALDLSNDIVSVDSADVEALCTYNEGSTTPSQPRGAANTALLSPGTRVKFSRKKDESSKNICPYRSELIFVSVVANDSCYLVPVLVGRTSCPTSAHLVGDAVSDGDLWQFKMSHLLRLEFNLCRLSFSSFYRQRMTSTWTVTHRVRSQITLSPTSLTIEKHPIALSCLQTIQNSILYSSLRLLFSLTKLHVSPTHPLAMYVISVLGEKSLLLAKYLTVDTDKVLSCVRDIVHDWHVRDGLRVEEVFVGIQQHLKYSPSYVDDVDSLDLLFRQIAGNENTPIDLIDGISVSTLVTTPIVEKKTMILDGDTKLVEELVERGVNYSEKSILKRLVLQHLLTSFLTAHKNAKLNVYIYLLGLLKQYLNQLIIPSLVAAKECITNEIPTIRNRMYDTDSKSYYSGYYNIISSSSFISFFKGMNYNIVIAEPVKGGSNPSTYSSKNNQKHFLICDYSNREDIVEASVINKILRFNQMIHSTFKNSNYVIKVVTDVAFSGDPLSGSATTMEWSSSWKSLEFVISRSGGLLRSGQWELFRVLSSRLLEALVQVKSTGGFILRSLNPNTIYIDDHDLQVKLLLLPVMLEEVISTDDGDEELMRLYRASDYVHADEKPLMTCCLPKFGNWKDSDISTWDSWSFGMCLYYMAFGCCPVKKVMNKWSIAQEIDPATTSSFIYFEFMHDLLLSKYDGYTNNWMNKNDILSGLDLQIISIAIDKKLNRLYCFRQTFIELSPSQGMTLESGRVVWERIIQHIFCNMMKDSFLSSIFLMKEKMALLLKDLNPDKIKQYFSMELNIILTSMEIEVFVGSLCIDLHAPFIERAKVAITNLMEILEEILHYGLFQQIIAIIGRCLCVSAKLRPSISDLLSLQIFQPLKNENNEKITFQLNHLIATYISGKDFIDQKFLYPIIRCVQKVIYVSTLSSSKLNIEKGGAENDIHIFSTDLSELSTILSCLEELVLLYENILLREYDTQTIELDSILQSYCFDLDSDWLISHCQDVFDALITSQILPLVCLYCLRFVSCDVAKICSGSVPMLSDTSKDGLSIGSKLLLRLLAFFNHLHESVLGMSRRVEFSNADLKREVGDRPADDVKALKKLKARVSIEAFLCVLMEAITMMYLGEEAPLRYSGGYAVTFQSAYPSVIRSWTTQSDGMASTLESDRPQEEDYDWDDVSGLDNITADSEVGFGNTYLESHWSGQICKLFEPLLLSIVGDDGKGTSKFTLSKDHLRSVSRTLSFSSQFYLIPE